MVSRSVLGAIVLHLKNTPGIAQALEGGNIWDMTQPPDEEYFPTVILGWSEDPDARSRGVRIGTLVIDLWDEGRSSERLERIRDEIEAELDYKTLTVGEQQWIRLFFGSEGQVPTESTEELMHWAMDFEARYFRQAWVERVIT